MALRFKNVWIALKIQFWVLALPSWMTNQHLRLFPNMLQFTRSSLYLTYFFAIKLSQRKSGLGYIFCRRYATQRYAIQRNGIQHKDPAQ
jgi:hypothetical protein